MNAPSNHRDAAEQRERVVPQRLAGHGRVHPGDQIDAGLDHGCRVQQGADGRRRFHRVGQPVVEREDRALGERAEHQQDRDGGEQAGRNDALGVDLRDAP
jgi:hypothetical protein